MKRNFTFGLMALTLACGVISSYGATKDDDIVILYRGNKDDNIGYTGISVYADGLSEIDLTNNPSVYDTPIMLKCRDTDVAFIGIEKGNPSTSDDDLYDAIQDNVNEAIANGADYIIAVSHLGDNAKLKPWRSVDVISNTYGIDAMIDGNPANVIDNFLVQNINGEDVILTHTGNAFKNIGKILINPESNAISSEFLEGSMALPYTNIYDEDSIFLMYPVLNNSNNFNKQATNTNKSVSDYVVKNGDNLSTIAENIYGDADVYHKIFNLNKNIIHNPDLIFPGQVLSMPKA
ncbi:MAG: hypothetical protein ATN31_01415 [Candidatus Epulonipiscioides saccharophilum]|nr:MAG: hypothetical protein ATN31_01415 [Epulopiscium sp. AS2M-Bin001]